MSDKLYNIVARVLKVNVSQINDQSGPETIETWDSFNGLVLVDELENEFNVKFTLEEVIYVRTVADIKKCLLNHGVNIDD